MGATTHQSPTSSVEVMAACCELSASPDRIKDTAEEDNPQGHNGNHVQGKKMIFTVVTLMLGHLMVSVDNTIITTIVPSITTEFHSLEDIGWYGSAYALTTMAMLPTFARMYLLFETKLVLILGIITFEVGSIICATAQSSPILILGRAIAGIGQAALLTGGNAIICGSFPLQKQPLIFGIIFSMEGIASLLGPPLGGLFTDTSKLGWRFSFWINVPLGAVVLFILSFLSPQTGYDIPKLSLLEKWKKIDILGTLLFVASLICGFLALEWGGIKYAWSDTRVWGCLVVFVITICLFAILQTRLQDRATIPPSLLRLRSVMLSCGFASLAMLGLMSQIYALPLYYQAVKGASALRSGLYLVPYLATVAISNLVVGFLLPIVGYGIPIMWFGCIMLIIASGLLTTLNVTSPIAACLGYQVLGGLGFGATVQVAVAAIQVLLPSELLLIGNSIFIFSLFLGNTLAFSIGPSIFNHLLRQELEKPFSPAQIIQIISAGATGISSAVSSQDAHLVREAYGHAISKVFFIPIGALGTALILTFGMKWWSIRRTK